MATAYLTYGNIGGAGQRANGIDVFVANSVVTETVNTSGVSASGGVTARRRQYVKIYCDTPVFVSVQPSASASNSLFIQGGISEYLALDAGDVVSVVDA